MHALIIVNDGMQTGGQGLFQIKTETNIAYKLLMLGAKNKGSLLRLNGTGTMRGQCKFGVKNYI